MPTLLEYSAARDRMFAALVERLEADERGVAAWLSGAHGRGEDDEWSDFDFCLAVRDGEMEAIRSDPMPLFALAGEVLLVQANFPSDTIPDGRFWLVVYPGPVHIDWNVGPASAAVRPRASRLLFEKQPIPIAANPPALPAEEAREHARKALEFFWAMAPIAVKYAGRGWTRRAVQQESLLSQAREQLWRLAHGRTLRSQDAFDQNRPPEPELLADWPQFGHAIDGAEALRVIREHCDAVETLHRALGALGVEVPHRMPAEVRALLEIADAEVAGGVIRQGTGSRR
ncbi:MAG: hypothetical protein WD557_17005 [Dehalococcoidia bacterium]